MEPNPGLGRRNVSSPVRDPIEGHQLMPRRWFVSVPRETAKKRLIKRHLAAGIESTIEAAAARAEENDLRNGDLIAKKMIRPDVIVESLDFVRLT